MDDLSPKTTRRRRAPAPPVPVVSQQDPPSPTPSRPSLNSVTTPTTQASLGHRRAASGNTPVSTGVVERPNIPPPAPPRPFPRPHVENGTKSVESSGADVPHDGLLDSNSMVSKPVTEIDVLESVTESSTDEISSNGEEKANRIAELRAQWFQNNAVQKGDELKSATLGGITTVTATPRKLVQSQVNTDLDPRPVKDTPRHHSPAAATQEVKNGVEKLPETAATISNAAEVTPVVSHSAESVVVKSPSPASKSSDGTHEHRPVPVARPRPPSSSAAVTTSNDMPADLPNNNQPKEIDVPRKLLKETADTSSKPDVQSGSFVKRPPPPPVVPRPANRQTSHSNGEPETGKSAVEPVVDESQEDDEEFDTRL